MNGNPSVKKTTLIVALFALFNLNGVYAQSISSSAVNSLSEYRLITVPDTANNAFFRTHPMIEKLVVSFSDERPYGIFVLFKDDKARRLREYYKSDHEVDSVIFKKLYSSFKCPQQVVRRRNDDDLCNQCVIATATVYMDSVRCSFAPSSTVEEDRSSRQRRVLATVPEYAGDMSKVAEKIRPYANQVLKPADSIIVFRGIVMQDGVLRNLELIVGRKSVYSDKVQKVFEQQVHGWSPAKLIESNATYESYIKIYIRINNDGTVSILTSPRTMVNITGR
ncbi:hypothetical protein [Niabella drilacis]|uniref:TonB protein C-terminal n=1 Tax=Niabella drilacis (strain DSM 25811 / CCM 8410 / CCUG 62505 / LMG 26954 / E90) TaxID=1285928 RepID=A0A1G6V203_NIADE|nr:hypothetical protein [Niabella drilacis]SDD47521.1 hypothetical protein SAMN04487894_109163 [Niabella drilacis]